ncbi:MAG: radical SAM protein [Candidatus Heimdallarchaeota archaeon]
MKSELNKTHRTKMDNKGRIKIDQELTSNYGIKSNVNIPLEERETGIFLPLPTRLLKLYIEPTNKCNLGCRTCIRNIWKEPMGMMSESVFQHVLDGLVKFSHTPTVFFGGFGEPLYHPKIAEMVSRVKALGSQVELITNGTLLTDELSRNLIKAGLDILWVSIDGASPDSFSDIRLGATLPKILENVANFSNILKNDMVINQCGAIPNAKTELGIAFVAMKRNISDLPAVIKLAQKFGAYHFLVTNVLPYTKEMCDEILYKNTLHEPPYPEPKPRVSIPLMDVTESTSNSLNWLMNYGSSVKIADMNLTNARNRCPFIENGVEAIGWDGGFSPCLSLMHDHSSYYKGRERYSRRWVVGNIKDQSLKDLWNNPEHIAFRERVRKFDFAPCIYCGGCELADTNESDCHGYEFPTCGGCLWAQGVIQCP